MADQLMNSGAAISPRRNNGGMRVAIFRVKIAGRDKPILARAESAAKLREALVEAKALTAKELADAFGEPVWTPGEPLPADEPIEDKPADPPTE
jgi:hypothetical protein